jgi:hypothetical protein
MTLKNRQNGAIDAANKNKTQREKSMKLVGLLLLL